MGDNELSDAFDVLLGKVRCEMDYTPNAEEQIEMRCAAIIREMDEFCALARNPETVDLIAGQSIAIGQIAFRANLILSFLAAQKPSALRIVR